MSDEFDTVEIIQSHGKESAAKALASLLTMNNEHTPIYDEVVKDLQARIAWADKRLAEENAGITDSWGEE